MRAGREPVATGVVQRGGRVQRRADTRPAFVHCHRGRSRLSGASAVLATVAATHDRGARSNRRGHPRLDSGPDHTPLDGAVMPEAVIVSTARSPIGRAMKGSLVSIRPDDLATQMVRAALDKVPELNPHQIDDLILGCGLPGGEQGFNLARVIAVELGYDFLPGTTVNRYCSSSLQTIRMASHAIKAGEGDAFISAGVETVSRFIKGSSDSLPDTKNPLFDE